MRGNPVKFGLIGFGAWGKMHAQSITRNGDSVLEAIAAPSEASCEEASRLYPQAKVFRGHRELLSQCDVDVVDIVTPSHTHRAICEDALNAGRHVLLEKPMALTVEDCQAMVKLAEERNRLLAIGHELRLSSQWGEVKRLIEAGTIGTPQYVLVELSRKPYRLGASGWRYDGSRVGSWILEEPIHFFDLARWYLSHHGDPETVYAVANSIEPSRPDLHDNFSAIMRYGSGAYAVVSQTLAAFEHHQTVKVTGTKGAIWAAWGGALDRTLEPTYSLRVFDGEKLEDVKLAHHSGEVFELREEIAMCVRCIREGSSPIATGRDGLWSAGLCLAAEESAKRSVPVSLAAYFQTA